MSCSIWDSISHHVASFLTAYDLVIASHINKAFYQSCKLNIFWKEKLLIDFNYKDKQRNRSEGFYKKYYLERLEDQCHEENLITGGH